MPVLGGARKIPSPTGFDDVLELTLEIVDGTITPVLPVRLCDRDLFRDVQEGVLRLLRREDDDVAAPVA